MQSPFDSVLSGELARCLGAVLSQRDLPRPYADSTPLAVTSLELAEPGPELPPLAAETPGIGPIGTESGIRACLGNFGVDAATAVSNSYRMEWPPGSVTVRWKSA